MTRHQGKGRLIALTAIVVATAGCTSANRPSRSGTSPDDLTLTGTRTGTLADTPDLFGYRAQRDRLLSLLEKTGEPDERAALTMELADLAERTRSMVLGREIELEQCFDNAAREERDRLDRLARDLLDEELKQLDVIAREFQEYSRRDEALYRLGFTLLDRGSTDAAVGHIRALFAEYPVSLYVPQGYLAFADYYFAREDIDQAIKLYEKVLAFESTDATPMAYFKLGWCWHNKGEHQKSLESFVDAVRAAQRLGGPVGTALRDEARKDLVRAYVQVGAPEKALEFFEQIDEGGINEMLERLGTAYFDVCRYEDSIVINRQVSARLECSPVQARAQVAVFEARLFLGEIDDLKAEGEALVEVFTRLSQCLQKEDLVEFAEVGAAVKETLKAQAERYRADFEMNNEPAAAEMADDLEALAESF